jgi:hypothetical protein
MELIKSGDTQYEEYENLLLERDQVQKEAGQIWTAYVIEFGQLISDVYKEQLECVKCKKIIAYYQNAINHGGLIDQDAMQAYLDQEMAGYNAELARLRKENEDCKNSGKSTPYEVQRSRTLYRRLAKLIHPDINPETDRQKKLTDLWQRIVTAYHHNDVKGLSELEVLVRRAMADLDQGDIKVDIPDIAEKIEALKAEIHEIIHTNPYTYKELLDSTETVKKKKDELKENLMSYQKYHQKLDHVIQTIITSGGIALQWRTK